VRLPLVIIKSLILWLGFSTVPGTVAFIFFRSQAAYGVVGFIGVILFTSTILAGRSLRSTLKPTEITIGPYRVFAIEDPSSHVFATQDFFSKKPTLWITRGALSLLTPEELLNLISGMRLAAKQGGLRFETVLTSWLVRMVRNIPSGFREILFFRQKRTKNILIRPRLILDFFNSYIRGFLFRSPKGELFDRY
jgi:hypothetical protein